MKRVFVVLVLCLVVLSACGSGTTSSKVLNCEDGDDYCWERKAKKEKNVLLCDKMLGANIQCIAGVAVALRDVSICANSNKAHGRAEPRAECGHRYRLAYVRGLGVPEKDACMEKSGLERQNCIIKAATDLEMAELCSFGGDTANCIADVAGNLNNEGIINDVTAPGSHTREAALKRFRGE
ncbi:MAG: hypothetical protein ACE5FT_01150 [Candidatus Nanoarchaeia archaeon]